MGYFSRATKDADLEFWKRAEDSATEKALKDANGGDWRWSYRSHGKEVEVVVKGGKVEEITYC